MKHIYILLIFCTFLFSQIRLSVSSGGEFNNSDINSGISLSYDKVVFKQANVKSGVGLEYMIPVDSKSLSYTDFSTNAIYVFLRFAYEKKWSSYLRFGFNDLRSNEFNADGVAIAFGADYKLNDSWHLESGYHIYTVDDNTYTKPVLSIVKHFKKKDD